MRKEEKTFWKAETEEKKFRETADRRKNMPKFSAYLMARRYSKR